MKYVCGVLFAVLGFISLSTCQFPHRGFGPLCPDNKRLDVRLCNLKNGRSGVCSRECLVPKNEYAELCCHLKEPLAFNVYYCCEEAIPLSGDIPIYNGGPRPIEFPYLASVGWYNERAPNAYNYKCTGVSITPLFLLTAAHCAIINGAEASVVKLDGVHLLEPWGLNTIEKVHIHPDYNPKTAYNDIALIELVKPYIYTTNITIWPNSTYPNSSFVAAGFGNTTSRGLSSNIVLKSNLEHVESGECERAHENEPMLRNGIAETQLCAKDLKNLSENCHGDSGGPLIMKLYENDSINKTDYLVGLTSFGQGCGSSPPGVYTRISAYIDWINSVLEKTDNTTISL